MQVARGRGARARSRAGAALRTPRPPARQGRGASGGLPGPANPTAPRRWRPRAPRDGPGRRRQHLGQSRPSSGCSLAGDREDGGGSQGFPRTPPRSWRVNGGAQLHGVLLTPCRPWVLSVRVAGAALSPRGPRAPPGVLPCCGPRSPPKAGPRTQGPGGPGRPRPPRSTPPGAGALGGRCCGLDAERDSRRQL